MTDNKDPQITVEELINQKITTQELLDNLHLIQAYSDAKTSDELVKKYQFLGRFLHSNGDIVIELLLQLSTELKQLRADNEISESTQAALYKSLLIIQRKYEQLRAERAGLIAEIDKEIIKLEPRLYKTDSEIEILYKFKKLKSKLTDSAQSGEGKQCD